MSHQITLNEALAFVKAAGYRVTKPKEKPEPKPLGLNAIGKPYGAGFDPKYRMKYRTPAVKGVHGGQHSISGFPTGEFGKERWLEMCKLAELAAVEAGRMQRSECRFI